MIKSLIVTDPEFLDPTILPKATNDDSVLNGLSLDSDRTWAVTANTVATAYRYYMYYTTQKKLTISRGAITLY
jgi:hypothetical protein